MTWIRSALVLIALVVVTAPAPADPYAEAHRKALDLKRPLVVWVGGNFCERCVEDSRDEFVHHFAQEWRGHRGPATVVYAPRDGALWRVATVEKWKTGTHDWGHVPSIRRVVGEWNRRTGYAPLPMLNFGDGNWGWPSDRGVISTGPYSKVNLMPRVQTARRRSC